MQSADNQKSETEGFDLARCDVHFCLVSGQPDINLLPVTQYRPRLVVLFVSEEMREAAENLKKAIRITVPGVRFEEVGISDAWSFAGNRDLIFDVLAEHEGERAAFNVTGGTKMLSFAALTAAWTAGVPAFYLNHNDGSISVIAMDREAERIRTDAVSVNLRSYFSAHGVEVAAITSVPTLNAKAGERIAWILKQESMRKAVPMLNFLASGLEGRQSLSADTACFEGSPNLAQFDQLCDYFQEMGRLRVQGRRIIFRNDADRFFAAGGWLEEHVASVLASIGLRPGSNVRVLRAGVENEIDVAFLHKDCLTLVECKTSNLTDVAEANKVIYKLETLRKFGGLKCRLVLVSYQPLAAHALKRAAEAGIEVISDRRLRDLAGEFRRVISQD